MGFCKFSTEYVISNQTAVDNFFISEFLPFAPENCVRVYLYGLYKCSNPNSYDNTIESFANILNLSVQDIEDIFLYWQEQGLVQVLSTIPIEVRYIPLKNVISNTKKFKLDKYNEFNAQAQQIIEGRMISKTEYAEYYTLLEAYHIQPEALIMTMKFCTTLKGKNVGWPYILTVARNWANEGVTTVESVEERIKLMDQKTSGIGEILKICGLKRLATLEEQEKFIKWKESWDFPQESIIHVGKRVAKFSGRANFDKINFRLNKYFELKKISISEIDEYESQKSAMFSIAKKLTKTIGVYYEDHENVVDTYISKWIDFGHNDKSLLKLADYCFKNSVRTLEGMNKIILKLYKLGIVNTQAIDEYIISLMREDNQIKEILERLGLTRNIVSIDREFFKTWKYSWLMPIDLIDFAIQKATGKAHPMQYMNKLLSTWHSKNITTVEQASAQSFENFNSNYTPIETKKKRKLSKEETSVLFDSLEELDIF